MFSSASLAWNRPSLKLLLRLWLVEVEKVRTTKRSILAWHFPVRLIALWHSEEFFLSRGFPCYLLDRQHGVYFNCWCSKIGQQLQTDLHALHSAWLFEQGKSTWMKTLSSLPEGERITKPAPAPSLVLVVCQTAAPCGRPLPAWIGSPPHQPSFRPVCRLLCHLRFWVLVMPLCFDWSIHPTKPLWDRNLYRTTKSLLSDIGTLYFCTSCILIRYAVAPGHRKKEKKDNIQTFELRWLYPIPEQPLIRVIIRSTAYVQYQLCSPYI